MTSVLLSPWYWSSLPLQNRSGSDIFAALFLDHPIATLLESPSQPLPVPLPHCRYSICAGQPRTQNHQPCLWTPEVGTIFPFLEKLLNAHLESPVPSSRSPIQPDPILPFQGGWLGWLGYGAAWEIETLPSLNPDPLPFPDAYWYEPDCFAVLDHQTQTLWLAASAPAQLEELEQTLGRVGRSPSIPESKSSCKTQSASNIQFAIDSEAYQSIVKKAQDYITQGDIFQANLSLRFESQSHTDPWQIYQQLQSINPSPFASFWKTPWGGLISCSPERLVQLRGQQAETRPIAGTRPRNLDPEQNRTWEIELGQNEKELAEHIMLVDLERNDLGRVCEWASVQVDELCVIEHYSHVMHLVSNVRGTLRNDHSPVDLIKAVFPGGTITGCPKVRCMEIIEALEPMSRSLFYGSCGYLDYRGNLDLNILIRTLLYSSADVTSQEGRLDHSSAQGRTFWGQVGAGIVADSQPHKEWQESMQKAKALIAALHNPCFTH